MRRSPLIVPIVVAALLVPASGPAAASGTGLVFPGSGVVAVPIASVTKGVRVRVCNGGAAPAAGVRAELQDFKFLAAGEPVGTPVLATPQLVSTDPKDDTAVKTLDAGACADVLIKTVKDAKTMTLDSGPSTGTVSVISKGEGVAQRQVVIAGPPATKVAPTGVAETVTLKAKRKWGLFNALFGKGGTELLDGGKLRLKAAPKGKDLLINGDCREVKVIAKLPDCLVPIGVVAHDQDTAQLAIGGKLDENAGDGFVALPVKITGAHGIGDYAGTVDIPGDGVADQAIKVRVSVSDSFWSMLTALLLGCLLTVGTQLYSRRWSPKDRLKNAADALAGEYEAGEMAFREQAQALVKAKKADKPPFRHFHAPKAEPTIKKYCADAKMAIKKYGKSTVYLDTASDAYKEVNTTIKAAGTDAACWKATDDDGLFGALSKLRLELDELRSDVTSWRFAQRRPAVADTAATVLRGRTLEIGQAVTLKAAAADTVALLEDWRELAVRTLVVQLWWRQLARLAAPDASQSMNGEDREEHLRAGGSLAEVKHDLLDAPDADALKGLDVEARLTRVRTPLAYLGLRYNVPEPTPDTDTGDLSPLWQPLRTSELTKTMLRLPSDAITTVTDWIKMAEEPKGATGAAPAEIRDNWRIVGDVAVLLVSVAAGLATALVAVGLGKNFGTGQDYLTVIVIGTAAQAFAASLLPSVNALLGDFAGSILTTPAKASAEKAA